MPQSQQKYQSSIYRAFETIETSDFYGIVRFFEGHEQEILYLEFEEYYEILHQYCEALFESGAYRKFIKVAPALIEATIQHNIKHYKGVDIYQHVLFKKAAAHYQLHEYQQAEHILRELVKIDPTQDLNSRFLKKCLYRKKPQFVKDTRAISIFIFLLSSLVIAVEILLIRNFFKPQQVLIELIRNGLFISGVVILVGGELIHYWRVGQKVHFFKKRARKSKKKPLPVRRRLEEV